MSALDHVRLPFVLAYLVVVTMIAMVLILVGFLLSRTPFVPAAVERTYTASMMRLLYVLVRPFDRLSPDPVEG